MAETPPQPVIPRMANGTAICSCGAIMDRWDYKAIPSNEQWMFYRCREVTDHVTAALPKGQN